MVLPVSDHVRCPGEDGVAEDLPRPQDILRGNLYKRVKSENSRVLLRQTENDWCPPAEGGLRLLPVKCI